MDSEALHLQSALLWGREDAKGDPERAIEIANMYLSFLFSAGRPQDVTGSPTNRHCESPRIQP